MRRPHNEVILDSIADGVFTVDRDWNITSFNRAAERITGVDRDQAIGQKCFDVLRADICQTACALRQTIETGEELIDHRVTILDAEGRRVKVSISTAVLRDQDGKIVGGVETFRDLTPMEILRKEMRRQFTFSDIISKSHEIQRIFGILPDIAASESTVLIEGPSGSGKELFARAIHNLSGRSRKPFVAVSCGALPGTLLESELFGYVRGAFTDAKADKPGRFAVAAGGTLFLDEIGELPASLQVKLLRVLQEREYEPLGATRPVPADVRVVAATNRHLSDQVSEGEFREDLYYRLNVVRIQLPPLARRREDIPLLVDHFIERFNARMGKRIEGVSDEVLDLLMAHPFPGNIRELENVIEHSFILCHGSAIEREHLPADLLAVDGGEVGEPAEPALPGARSDGDRPGGRPARDLLAGARAAAIRAALERNHGDRRRTAAELGIHTTTLWRWMKKLRIRYPSDLHGRQDCR
jgi:PAS domain S-box-containing protein